MKLYNRLSSFYIVINVPKCLRKRIGKSQIWRSLHTKDRRIANLRAGMIKMSVHKLFTEEQMKEAQEIDGMLRDISCDGIGHSEMDYTEDFAEMVAYEACREKVNYAKTYLVSEMIEEYQQKLKIYRDTRTFILKFCCFTSDLAGWNPIRFRDSFFVAWFDMIT